MDLGLKNKAALVLASGAGIGQGIATQFAKEGANVMLFDLNEDGLIKTQKMILESTGTKPPYFVGDITKREDIEGVVEKTCNEFGSIYALVNNTGGPKAGTFEDFDDDAWMQAFELTLLSYVRSIRAVLPIMKKAKTGRIVSNTSSSIKNVIDNLLLSNVFRTGILGLSKSLAREFGEHGILVNVIGPGKIATDRVAHLDGIKAKKMGKTREEIEKQFTAQIPLGRYGSPDEIARLAVFLCSEANTYITGQSILADGGMVKSY